MEVAVAGSITRAATTSPESATTAPTEQVNTAIKRTAAAYGSAYVDLRAAFKGPDYAFDETHYLSNDGDHPNVAGHEQIAAAVVEVVTQTLRT
jgi:lysophospholipase L1-like esterase